MAKDLAQLDKEFRERGEGYLLEMFLTEKRIQSLDTKGIMII